MKHEIKRVLLIGSGPVVIGQAAEYDYSGVQACRALKSDGIAVVLVNSNPAAVMCDKQYADALYIEPLNIDVIKRIIKLEKPDSILPTLGGDLGLTLTLELYRSGYLEEQGIRVLGLTPQLIQSVQEHGAFSKTLAKMGLPGVQQAIVSSAEAAFAFAQDVGLPILVKPAYSRSGAGDLFCYSEEEVAQNTKVQLAASKTGQVRVEKCISGWKELEYEVMRDAAGNCICVSNLENIDPVGIHTGDSVIVTPAQTLTETQSEQLRASALRIAQELGVVGSCNIQFALHPDSDDYVVLEIDPRVSRSSALVSKATGYPIAWVATKAAIGHMLYEIPNEITGCTTANNEPAIDYCCIKFPKWSFDRFDDASRRLGTSMLATGETLGFGTSFELAFMKAVRAGQSATPSLPKFRNYSREELLAAIKKTSDERIFAVYEAIKRGETYETIYALTQIDAFFLSKLHNIAQVELALQEGLTESLYRRAKAFGFLDDTIQRLSGASIAKPAAPRYKMVDTCAAEFDAQHPYFYAAWDDDNEAQMFQDVSARGKRKVLVVGAGPAAVGYGSELEYCNTQCLQTLREEGYHTVCVNNNPQAVSTDYHTSDRLYMEPLHAEDIRHILATERPWGVVLQFAGEHALPLLRALEHAPVRVLGAHKRMLELTATKDAMKFFLRDIAVPFASEYHPVATGFEMDVLFDGESCLVPGVSEHIERSGSVHAGDTISVYPTLTASDKILAQMHQYGKAIAKALHFKGILNIQFMLHEQQLYVTGVSPSALHNVPFISKATGLPVVKIATACMLGTSLQAQGYADGIYPVKKRYTVRVPVFSFDRLAGADTQLGKQMKSTGEVIGQAASFEDALLKALVASGMRIQRRGTALFTMRDSDKQESIALAEKFAQLDFSLVATAGTARLFNKNHVPASSVRKFTEDAPNIMDFVESGKCAYIISTTNDNKEAQEADRKIRRFAVEKQIPVFTQLDTANAFVRCLAGKRKLEDIALINILE